MKKGKQKKVVTQSAVDRRSEQLNPLNERFLKSRQTTLTQEDVSLIQRTEVLAHGKQLPGGLGAQAQQLLAELGS
jgi:hypothetical protein